MNIFESLQKLVPWISGLPIIPKITITTITVLFTALFLYLIWAPPTITKPTSNPSVIAAYKRMEKVLSRLTQSNDGRILLDKHSIPRSLEEYYVNYFAIAVYIAKNTDDIDGAYEEIWAHGGESRVFINDTEVFEAVVSGFFRAYEAAK